MIERRTTRRKKQGSGTVTPQGGQRKQRRTVAGEGDGETAFSSAPRAPNTARYEEGESPAPIVDAVAQLALLLFPPLPAFICSRLLNAKDARDVALLVGIYRINLVRGSPAYEVGVPCQHPRRTRLRLPFRIAGLWQINI